METLFTDQEEHPGNDCLIKNAISVSRDEFGDLVFRHVEKVDGDYFGRPKEVRSVDLGEDLESAQAKVDEYLATNGLNQYFEVNLRDIIDQG